MGHAAHPAPATRPALEVAHILREGAETYRETHRLSSQQQRVVNALTSCRTAALGGFKAHCDHCGAVTIQYASCRNRHCPKCQTLAQTRWVERQCADLLDIAYWHVIFTLPHELNPVAQGNPALIYRLLFNAASKTLLEFGRIRRFLLHVLPRGFTRLRHYGVLANRGRARKLALCRTLLAQPEPEPREPESPEAMMLRLTGIDITVCRECGRGTLRRITLAPQIPTARRVAPTRPP